MLHSLNYGLVALQVELQLGAEELGQAGMEDSLARRLLLRAVEQVAVAPAQGQRHRSTQPLEQEVWVGLAAAHLAAALRHDTELPQ